MALFSSDKVDDFRPSTSGASSTPGTLSAGSSSGRYALGGEVPVVKSSGCGFSFFSKHKHRKTRMNHIADIVGTIGGTIGGMMRSNKVAPHL